MNYSNNYDKRQFERGKNRERKTVTLERRRIELLVKEKLLQRWKSFRQIRIFVYFNQSLFFCKSKNIMYLLTCTYLKLCTKNHPLYLEFWIFFPKNLMLITHYRSTKTCLVEKKFICGTYLGLLINGHT